MKPPPFTYHDPSTVAEALEILSGNDNARLLAGGQSLMPMLAMRFVLPDDVIDINNIAELSGIEETGEGLRIGAMTRQRDIEFSDVVRRRFGVSVQTGVFSLGLRAVLSQNLRQMYTE